MSARRVPHQGDVASAASHGSADSGPTDAPPPAAGGDAAGASSGAHQQDFAVHAPAVSLPKGGGAIRGIGEKFAANPVTGTGSIKVPIATSPGRSGFGPKLSLAYDSGAGNGPFGFGWSLSIPSIARKTSKGLPAYRDAEDPDVYVLSGAEDLVPVLEPFPSPDPAYAVRRYRPRVEELFARIERWTHNDTGEIHWRAITRDNVTSIYGPDNLSRIFDPDDPDPEHPTRIFSWLLRRSYDDKGNVIVYEYAAEDDAGVDRRLCNERNRTRTANRYLARIRYGNRTSWLAVADSKPENLADDDFLFLVVFDYDQGRVRETAWDAATPARDQHRRVQVSAEARAPWTVRPDPFSTYRAGFEVRSYRRCRRVLVFHRFDELEALTGGQPYLVRAIELHYADLDYGAPVGIDDELAHHGSTRFASFIQSITQSGFVHDPDGRADAGYVAYLRKSLPPLELEYEKALIVDETKALDAVDAENLPVGLDDKLYRWVDLDGEGISGILSEQADAWRYKPNLGGGHFGPLGVLPTRPNATLASGRQQLMDLAGDGTLDVVAFGEPLPGFYERTGEEGWAPFRTFEQLPNISWHNPNLRMVDLDGDGHADVLIAQDDVFTWYRSRGEQGFDAAARTYQPDDEERGPRLVFADGTESIHLADMSGDGLVDLVRIRNGEVCYWPNVGYGRFGARVTMDGAPWFDDADQFDQARIRLADIDGSGTNDIVYLHREGVRLYFNQSGNRWSEARPLRLFPPVDGVASVKTADLFGNGTACLVWSSPLPSDAGAPLRYVELMGGKKPHLLIRSANNLGMETQVDYAPSTRFYLEDKRAGTPWVTKIPFPVHCVEKVTVTDRWRGCRFSTSYSYHHGHFDGFEREFRGFGRVEQVDSESYGRFAAGNANSPYITDDKTLYQPPVKTITWHHTGALLDRRRILSHYAAEYFPRSLGDAGAGIAFAERELPEPDLAAQALSADEFREALRACKGKVLRRETYELDVDALAAGRHVPVKLVSAASRGCHVKRLQAQKPEAGARHAVFLVTGSETITYHYELDLRESTLAPDPRVAHTLDLAVDDYGHVLQSVTAVYPRIGRYRDPTLPAGAEDTIAAVQQQLHVAYTETRYTTDDIAGGYRVPVVCEVQTFELTGVEPAERYFSLAELRRLRLSERYQPEPGGLTDVASLPYHQLAGAPGPHKRCVEQVRTLFFADDLGGARPFGEQGRLGLVYEKYRLALTEDLLAAVFAGVSASEQRDARRDIRDPATSGYLGGTALRERFGDAPGGYWIRSGVAGYADGAARTFYQPERYTDAFGNTTTLGIDSSYHLLLESKTDPAGNTIRVEAFDYRVPSPSVIRDPNGNRTEAVFDILGMPAAVAARGKGDGSEGDGPLPADVSWTQPPIARVAGVFTGAYREGELQALLGAATARHLYWFGETVDATTGAITYGTSPSGACDVIRETHVADLAPGEASAIQVVFEYSDGGGHVLARKMKAEPAPGGTAIRWLTAGKTVLNNKGKPVKKYEPYFSASEQRFEEPAEVGVTPIVYYDAVGRVIRTEQPDGSYSRVTFSPWQVQSFDANDTVLEPGNTWYASRDPLDPRAPLPTNAMSGEVSAKPEQRAAWLAAQHADTPSTVFLDSLGRKVVAVAHNVDDAGHEKYVTFTKLDAEGKPLWIRDARGNLVMQYITPPKPTGGGDDELPAGCDPCYDVAGRLLFSHSMDAGDRWMLPDAAGKSMYGWDANDRVKDDGTRVHERRIFHTTYDALHRPLEHRLAIGAEHWVVERRVYGEPTSAAGEADARARNLRGKLHRHYDPSGLVTNEQFDFKGKLEKVSRQLTTAVTAAAVDWSEGFPDGQLAAETYERREEHDALGRMKRLVNWHRDGTRVMVYQPAYNERGLLAAEDVLVGASLDAAGKPSGGRRVTAASDIQYDAKGQRERIVHGNGTVTRHHYDPQTFRLAQIRTTRAGFDPAFPGYRANLDEKRVLQQLLYTYDAVGNITEISDDAYQVAFFRNQVVKPRNLYAYDALYRLTRATGLEDASVTAAPAADAVPRAPRIGFPVGTTGALRTYEQRYSYDGVGNIVQMRHVAGSGSWTRSYTYAADSNRLESTRTGNGAAATLRYDHDLHGSMLHLGNAPAELHLRWDYRDMIRSANLGGGGTAYYAYDAGKQRTAKSIRRADGSRWERLYLGGMELYRDYSTTGAVVEEIETHHLFVDRERVLMVDDVLSTDNAQLGTGTLLRYQHGNHLGSVGLELDEHAGIISYEAYHPYGTSAYRARAADIRATRKRYRYTGMERDEETGLAYHTARYYAAWIGRWASSDPAGLVGGIDSFAYVNADPIGLQDPHGKQARRRRSRASSHRRRASTSPEGNPGLVPSPRQATRWVAGWSGSTLPAPDSTGSYVLRRPPGVFTYVPPTSGPTESPPAAGSSTAAPNPTGSTSAGSSTAAPNPTGSTSDDSTRQTTDAEEVGVTVESNAGTGLNASELRGAASRTDISLGVELERILKVLSVAIEGSTTWRGGPSWQYSAVGIGARIALSVGWFRASVAGEYASTETIDPTGRTATGDEGSGRARAGVRFGPVGFGVDFRFGNVRTAESDQELGDPRSIGGYARLELGPFQGDLSIMGTFAHSTEDPAVQRNVVEAALRLSLQVAHVDGATLRFFLQGLATIPAGGDASGGGAGLFGFTLENEPEHTAHEE